MLEYRGRVASTECPPDEEVTGGGFKYSNSENENVINPDIASAPNGNTWEAFASNPGPGTMSVDVCAKCVKLIDVP